LNLSAADVEIPEEHVISLGEIESLILNAKFGIGEFNLSDGEDNVFKGNFHYKNSLLEPQIRYDILGENGFLDLSQSIIKNIGAIFSLRNVWDLKLPINMPIGNG